MDASPTQRTLTELDHLRLMTLLRRGTGDAIAARRPTLEAVLDASDTVPSRQVAPDVVTMYSRAVMLDSATQQRTTLTLCYPADAEPAAGFVSVLSPVGSALLGLQVGDLACWATPSGEQRSARVLAILFQPEASGDYEI